MRSKSPSNLGLELGLGLILILSAFLRLYGLGNDPLFRDEAYYYVWSKNPSLSYYDHPPAVALLISASTSILGESEFGIRFLFACVGLETVLLVYLLGKRYFDTKVGLMASALYAFEFGNVLFSRLAFNDAPLVMLFALFLLLYPKDGKFNLRTSFLLGIILGAGLLTKYTMFVIPVAIIFYSLLSHFSRKSKYSTNSKNSNKGSSLSNVSHIFLIFAIALFCFLPVISWNYSHDFASFSYQGGHAASLDIFSSLANGDYFFDIFYFPRRMALGFTPASFLILSFASILFAFEFHEKTSRAILFVPAFLFAFIAIFAGAIPIYFDPTFIPIDWKILVFICYIPQALFLLFFFLSIKRFRTDSHRFFVICGLAPMLLFSFSNARLPHWALPALVPFSILGAELLDRMPQMLKTNLKLQDENQAENQQKSEKERIEKEIKEGKEKASFKNNYIGDRSNILRIRDPSSEGKVAFIIFILILSQCAAYSVTSIALRSKPISEFEIPFRSGYSSSWYTSEISIKNMATDFDSVYSIHEGSFILTPTWQTYAGLVYYSKYAKTEQNKTYTFAYDYQIGIVFKKDVANSKSNITNATIVIYKFSHQNFTTEEILHYLVYSPINDTNYGNSWTVYNRTGLDFYIIEKKRNDDYPYIIAYAEFRNLTYVSVQIDGTVLYANKSDISYEGRSGKPWIEIFDANRI